MIGCYAGIPGSGPDGQICARCALLTSHGSRFVCAKYSRLTGKVPKPIGPSSPACKYFELRARPATLAKGH
jgi:hypothetical protein